MGFFFGAEHMEGGAVSATVFASALPPTDGMTSRCMLSYHLVSTHATEASWIYAGRCMNHRFAPHLWPCPRSSSYFGQITEAAVDLQVLYAIFSTQH